jgi:hypothetical protein
MNATLVTSSRLPPFTQSDRLVAALALTAAIVRDALALARQAAAQRGRVARPGCAV